MTKLLMTLLLPIFLLACTTNIPISVVNAEPQNCTYLTTVSIPQCSAGALASVDTTERTLKALKFEVIKAGGDTMECCAVEKEETIVSGVNPESGKTNCVGVVRHSANVYKCKNKS